jgi:SAM-dependent methyltransferase
VAEVHANLRQSIDRDNIAVRTQGSLWRPTLIDDVSDIAAFYNNDPEKEHFRLEKHPLEYELTWRYLDQYLPARGSILEIGAATGRYTLELARRGYTVMAVDLSEAESGKCRQRIAEAGLEKYVRVVVADARDLGGVAEREFDAVLLMGPLYHLVVEADRRAALRAAFERLREGGIIFSAFISRFGILCDLIKDVPDWIEDQAEVRSILERGKDPHDFPHTGFRGYFARAAEIAPLHEGLGIKSLVLAGVEPVIAADDESYNRLEGQQRKLWLDLFYEVSTEAAIIGASRHLLYIGKK